MNKVELLKKGFKGELLFVEFSELTGMIFGGEEVKSFLDEWEEELKECGLYDEIDENTGYIDANWTTKDKLKYFLEKHGETFHVVTQCIEGEKEYWENRMATVNRMNFVLALGNRNHDVYFSEEYQKEREGKEVEY